MKSKLTHALRSLPAGSILTMKGTTLHSNKGYFHLWLPNSVPTQGCQNVTGCRPSASTCASRDLGWTLLFNWKGQFFPSLYSWCGAFDPNMHSRINQSKPTCIWTGLRLQVTQKTTLNTQCINHSHWAWGRSQGKSVMILTPKPRVDVTPRSKSNPRPLSQLLVQEKEPQMIVTWLFIQCVKLRMMYTDDTRVVSSNITHHHKLWVQETSGGKLGTLTSYRHARAILTNIFKI